MNRQKIFSLAASFLFLAFATQAGAQYFYQDILVPRLSMQKWKAYKENKVKSVKLSSFESNGEPTPGFDCNQVVSDESQALFTYTQTSMSNTSGLMAYYDASGFLTKTLDTGDTYQSTTLYSYDAAGHVITVRNTYIETDNKLTTTESHEWTYTADGKPAGVVKIRNGTDTTQVRLVLDAKGNIIEEHPVSRQLSLPVVYYYYDSANRLTDIVRYNERANRLLPDYVFERDPNGKLKTMLFVPPGSNDYQKWYYEYFENGLEKRESCYNKRNELLGKIEYHYDYKKS